VVRVVESDVAGAISLGKVKEEVVDENSVKTISCTRPELLFEFCQSLEFIVL